MPRPGPRPYECVRRAWHSERHQPIRGSIIQQIFRVVSESHTPATKKNKEWQEKLPVVVLKAEEILYSKANSEAEYVNVETLWDRLNDAISTIIRRDESTETGELLPPCVEATLNLGCTPVKASRSQRHNNPRTYLSPRVQEPPSIPSTNVDSSTNEQSPQLHQLQSPDQSKFERPTIANSGLLISESNRHIPQNNNPTTTCNFPFRLQNSLPRGMQSTTMESNTSLSFGSVYPLYYGTQYQLEGSQHLRAQIPEMSNSNNVLLGVPIGPSIQQPIERGFLQRFPSINVNENAQADLRETHEKASGIECDLSLRLGLFPDTCMSTRKHSVRETKDADSSSSQDESNLSETLAQRTEFSFFPKGIADGPFASCSR